MKENLNIEQNQQTVQRLSPRQVQFVRLLEMSTPELEDEVARQLDDNPALEKAEHTDAPAEADDETPTIITDDTISYDPDDDPADYIKKDHTTSESYYAPQIAAEQPDLYTMLNQQLGEADTDESTRNIARYIAGNIDENGYVTRSLASMADDIAIATGEEVTHEQMKKAFELVRSLDPAGVGAVDLRDCLLLQLRRITPTTLPSRIATETVDNYFDLLSKKHYDRLQAQFGLKDATELRKAIELIRSLNPKPGSAIEATQTALRANQISPDVAVEETEDGRFSVWLINTLPELQIEKSFTAENEPLPDAGTGASAAMRRQAQSFIKLKRDDAEAFISALQQRSNTLLSVTEAIVKLQSDFFKSGDKSKLHPMILKDVANLTGHDISVVSRATAGKYVSTESGIYPLKMFFNEAPQEDSDTSSHELLDALQTIINGENKRHPLSDEAIREAMASKGYNLARRTITKYREKLGIPVGRLRKESI